MLTAFKKFALAGIILLTLISSGASAAVKYVDCVAGSNAWPGTSDSPYASIAYSVARMAAYDTLYIIANGDSFYNEAVNVSDTEYHLVGVSVGGDSPVWRARTATGVILQIGNGTGDNDGMYVGGIKFVDTWTYNYSVYCYSAQNERFEGCIFEKTDSTTTNPPLATYQAALLVSNYNASTTKSHFITNCSFLLRGSHMAGAIVALHGRTNDGQVNNIYINNCTIRSDSGSFTAHRTDSLYVEFNNCIIDARSYLIYGDDGSGNGTARIVYNFCDLHDTYYTYYRNDGSAVVTAAFNFNSVIYSDPLFVTTDTLSAIASLAYLYDTSPCLTASSSSGLIGVLWGWSGVSEFTTLRYRQPFCDRFRRILWRPM